MANPARTSEIAPAPTHTGMQLDGNGVITAPSWLAYFQRIAFPMMQLTLQLRDAAAFEPISGQDLGPQIEEIATVTQAGERNYSAEVDELQKYRAATDAPRDWTPELDELQRHRAAVDPLRDWTPEIEELRQQLAAVDVPRSAANSIVIVDTHANRVNYDATDYPNSLYFETDRKVLYLSIVTAGVGTWTYIAGTMSGLLAAIPNDLAAADVNFRFGSTDYFHEHRWDGAAWHFAPGDPGSGWCAATAGGAPAGGRWAACNGTAALAAQDDGTTALVGTPNTWPGGGGDSPFILGGSGGAQQTATPASWDAAARTDASTAGTQTVQAGVGATVGSEPHTHPLGNVHALILAPSEVNGGLPLRVSLAWYMRL